ncbi:MAG: EpsG family protein [Bacteroidaceae bacterium]|nr:EpsG family protein [Bacteroidaceae bacterium]
MFPLPLDPRIFPVINFWGISIFCILLGLKYVSSDSCDNLLQQKSPAWATIFCFIWIFFLGLRPAHYTFGDTAVYAHTYLRTSTEYAEIDFHKEWLFALFRTWCRAMGFSVTTFFLLIELGYVGFMLLAFKKLLWEDTWLAVLFFFSAYSFYVYGVNGIRNGLACSICLAAFAIILKDKNYLMGSVLLFAAFSIHKSTLLPIAALVAALFVIKKPRLALFFWLASIPLSLVAGGPISNFFMSLGFDDRTEAYLSGDNMKYGNFSNTGFRWDFLLYSAMPVWLIWEAQKKIEKKREEMGGVCAEEEESGVYGAGIIADTESMRIFNVLSTIYLLTNAFWVMVIKAAFSNRFAYLSWFLYPLIIAYAVVRLHIWEDQDRKAGWILIGHAAFTMFMFLTGKI